MTASYRQALISERAFGLSALHEQNLGQFWPVQGYWNNAVLHYLDVMDRYVQQTAEPYHVVVASTPSAIPKRTTPWEALGDLGIPAIEVARKAAEKGQALLRCLRIVNEITRLEQQGVEVTGLADLDLPGEGTRDPFSSQPLLLKKLPHGWVVYSVGENLEDDGGRVDDQTDIGLGPVSPPVLVLP
jgi:hypothetical protein